MSLEQSSLRSDSLSETEVQIKSLLKSLSAEIEREISIKECRQATSTSSLPLKSSK
tara:strand:+ start:250 stop:417 length:168 start_codon:yes stop_codon:yes gene_type:complete